MATRNTFLVINEPAAAKSKLEKVGGDIVQPYAQVIMLDADFGDSNFVDVCRAEIDPATGNYKPMPKGEPTFFRAIIDTGPYKPQLVNLERVITEFGQPKVRDKVSNTIEEPAIYDDALVGMLQLTHVDEDHCGQGPALMKLISEDATVRASFRETPVVFHEVPAINPPFMVRLKTKQSLECELDPDWISPEDLLDLAKYRFTYDYQWQALDNAMDDPDDADWKNKKLFKHGSTLRWVIEVGDIGKKSFLCFQVSVSLERFRKSSQAVGWVPVLARKQTAPATTKGNKKVPRTIEAVPVCWTNHFTYRAITKNKQKKDKVEVELKGAKAAPLSIPLGSTGFFTSTAEGIQELIEDFQKAKKKKKTLKPYVMPGVPLAVRDDLDQELSESWQCNIVGPTKALYLELMAEIISRRYQYAETEIVGNVGLDVGPYYIVGNTSIEAEDISNRASILTLFRRYALGINGKRTAKAEFDMLFTGDAYDRDCDVQNTIQAFNGTAIKSTVDVLKVPHHGSKNTSDANFYNNIRARIYLICGAQYKHGNPSLAMLEALASGFEEPAGTAASASNAALLFFSDYRSLDDVESESGDKFKSNVYQLLHLSNFRPNTNPATARPMYNYRCFRLREAPGNDLSNKKKPKPVKSAGRILFGRNAAGGLAIQFTLASQVDDANGKYTELNDWVEMEGTP